MRNAAKPMWIAEWQDASGAVAMRVMAAYDTEADAQARADRLTARGTKWVIVYRGADS